MWLNRRGFFATLFGAFLAPILPKPKVAPKWHEPLPGPPITIPREWIAYGIRELRLQNTRPGGVVIYNVGGPSSNWKPVGEDPAD